MKIIICDKCGKELSENTAQEIKLHYDEAVPTPIAVFGERYFKTYYLCNKCVRKVCDYITKEDEDE